MLRGAASRPFGDEAERELAESVLPTEAETAATWSVAAMELGALVCTAKAPRCGDCPVTDQCAWLAAGSPAYAGPPLRRQAWTGTDRQCRGRVMSVLREAEGPVPRSRIDAVWPDAGQRERCLAGLLSDGLVVTAGGERFALPGELG